MKYLIVGLILLSLVGVAAAAYNMNIVDPLSTKVLVGDSAGIVYTINLGEVPAYSPHTIKADVSSGTDSDLQFKFEYYDDSNTLTSSGWINSGQTYNWYTSGVSKQFKMYVRAVDNPVSPIGTTYSFKVKADTLEALEAVSSTTATTVPEFPTVALPVAAILGLAFVFMRRKE